MLRLEQMTDGNESVYKFEYKKDGITVIKYFKEVDKETELDLTQLKSVENGLLVEVR